MRREGEDERRERKRKAEQEGREEGGMRKEKRKMKKGEGGRSEGGERWGTLSYSAIEHI